MTLFNIIQITLLVLSALATSYIFVFALASLFYRQPAYLTTEKFNKIAVLIPGYKEDEVIVGVAQAALEQVYPAVFFDIVIIADSFQAETLANLNKLPVTVIEVKFDNSTKSKALNKAMDSLIDAYDIAVVLDADNVMAPDFLTKINSAFARGSTVVQGHRTAKNVNNSWAVLDAVSEEINNSIFRKGHRVLGFSSAIIGSGMAFEYSYFKTLMSTVDAVGGFDKEIELKMLKQGHTIHYLDDAIVFDEKIQKSAVFANQRRRWLAAQFHYFRKYFLDALQHLFLEGNVDYFDKAFQFIQPPRILLLGGLLIFAPAFIIGNHLLHNATFYNMIWITITLTCIAALLMAVPYKYYTLKSLRALSGLPKGMFIMLLSLLKIKGANKTFIHTSHTSNTTK